MWFYLNNYLGVLLWLVVLGVEQGRKHFRLPDASTTVARKYGGVCETYVPYAIKMSEIIVCIYLYVHKNMNKTYEMIKLQK